MADLPNTRLEPEYAAAADDARRTVAAALDLRRVGTAALPPGVTTTRFRDVWRVALDEGSPVPYLLVAIPWIFPDELPDIYVSGDLTFEGARIPHVDGFRQVCTLDDSSRFPNPGRGGDAVLEIIGRASDIIREGLEGKNRAEYWDEFEAYWVDGAKNLTTAVSLVRPQGPHREIVVARFTPKLGPATLVFAESETAAFDFLEAVGRPPEKPTSAPAVYLHLDDIGETPNLRTNADVKRVLPADAYEVLLQFLKKDKRPSIALFSIPVARQRVFGGWVHEEYATNVYKGAKSVKVRGQAPGFRPGHLPPDVELTTAFGGQAVGRIVVRRADAQRFSERSVGYIDVNAGAVNVIGCGSVGGYVARALSYGAPSPLRLVDSEDLDVHNVPRHVCDLTSVGQNKAEAVRRLLRRSDPHLQVEALPREVLEIMRTEPERLQPASHTVLAVANVAVERRVNAVARDLDLGTIAYVWIEPHAVAGHAIVVPARATGCFECLVNDTGGLDLQVLDQPESFSKADAGCRGSFVPYGGADLETFAMTVAREITVPIPAGSGITISWIGNLDAARSNGWALSSMWADAANYSLHRRPIAARDGCTVCSR